MTYRILIQRIKEDINQTTGAFSVIDANGWAVMICPCIERGDRDNQRGVSSVLAGTYRLVYEWSPKFGRYLWELYGTLNRSECKIHSANFWRQLNGCISLGLYLTDFDKDGYQDVAQSVNALNAFHRIMDRMVVKGITETSITILDPIK